MVILLLLFVISYCKQSIKSALLFQYRRHDQSVNDGCTDGGGELDHNHSIHQQASLYVDSLDW